MENSWRSLPNRLSEPEREFVEALRLLKDTSGLTLVELAATTHYSKSSWQRWLNGDRLAAEPALLRLCEIVGAAGARRDELVALRSAAQDAPAGPPAVRGSARGPQAAPAPTQDGQEHGSVRPRGRAELVGAMGVAAPPGERVVLLPAGSGAPASRARVDPGGLLDPEHLDPEHPDPEHPDPEHPGPASPLDGLPDGDAPTGGRSAGDSAGDSADEPAVPAEASRPEVGTPTPGWPSVRRPQSRTGLGVLLAAVAVVAVLTTAVTSALIGAAGSDAPGARPPAAETAPPSVSVVRASPSVVPVGPLNGNCQAAGCVAKDPQATGCVTDAVTLSVSTVRQMAIYVRYSPHCKAAWAKITDAEPGFSATIVNASAQSQVALVHWGYDAYSPMVDASRPDAGLQVCGEQPGGRGCGPVIADPASAPVVTLPSRAPATGTAPAGAGAPAASTAAGAPQ